VELQNQKTDNSYQKSLETIKTIWIKLQDDESRYGRYLFLIADKILYYSELEAELSSDYQNNSIQDLRKTNLELYHEILPDNYEESFANPAYAVQIFGSRFGALFSAYFIAYRNFISYAFQHQRFRMEKWNKLFIEVYEILKADQPDLDKFAETALKIQAQPAVEDSHLFFLQNYHPETLSGKNIVLDAYLTDIRYLYQYGRYVSENEIKTAEYLINFSQQKIDMLADAISKAFYRGYQLANKDISKKNCVGIYYHIGQERIVRSLYYKLSESGLKANLANFSAKIPNKQYNYDHRFDSALYLNEKYVNAIKKNQELAAAECSDFLKRFAGSIYFDAFGEEPFAPLTKPACLKLSQEQQQLSQKQRMNFSQLFEKHLPRSQTSFCIVGFPTPEIGDHFAEIFEETIGINMMDTIRHEEIQQCIVDALDKAEFVHVKGKNGNLTDIKVKMHKLNDPAKQSNFVNCGAEVNIPVGEVFTTPVLNDTNGTLHLKETFLKGLKFIDLNLRFEDGYVAEYSCKNFENEEENRKYILENLLFPHKTLPIGEFAIGTNTKAYMMAKRFDILPLLPVLIVEKMGPHFAIGDTCFSWEEDSVVFNPIDKKEITARENERSALRKTDINKAYTNCHTDITLPYEDLDFIAAVTESGDKFDIIRDGRFVIPGTEELNLPLDEKKNF
jgi:leucyl aminopeptidase (aminopeptidase T)